MNRAFQALPISTMTSGTKSFLVYLKDWLLNPLWKISHLIGGEPQEHLYYPGSLSAVCLRHRTVEEEKVTNKQELWDKYLHINSFKGALWKAAEGAYGAVYYAYENLVVNILNADRKSPCRVTQRDFNSIVSESFGNSVASKVWSNVL